ncbi:MAG: SRPBCC family protein [Acidimicrobiales bacterium]
MARIKVSTVLDAPPADVWADVERIATHPEWMADAVGITFLTAQTSGVGTRFECATKVGPVRLTDVMEITEWSPGRAMGVTHTGLVTGTGRFTLKRASRGRTLFQWKERLHFPLWMGGPLGAFVSKPILTWVWRRSLRNLHQRF